MRSKPRKMRTWMLASLLTAGAVLFALPLHRAATLKGQVVLNRVCGQPMAGAAVAAEGANPTTSDRLGWFTLDFPSKGPGDLVKLTVSKPELVSVHWIMLDVTLPSKAGGMNVLPLLMARESDRLEMAAEFFRFAKPACD